MTQGTPEWYVAVAAAIAKRERAISMISRWEKKRDEAEAEVQALTGGAETSTEQITE